VCVLLVPPWGNPGKVGAAARAAAAAAAIVVASFRRHNTHYTCRRSSLAHLGLVGAANEPEGGAVICGHRRRRRQWRPRRAPRRRRWPRGDRVHRPRDSAWHRSRRRVSCERAKAAASKSSRRRGRRVLELTTAERARSTTPAPILRRGRRVFICSLPALMAVAATGAAAAVYNRRVEGTMTLCLLLSTYTPLTIPA